MIKNIFISYSSKNIKEAYNVCEYLENSCENINCWIAPRNIQAGYSYAPQIVEAIEKCDIFILIATKEINDSQHVNNEVALAFENRKVLIPFKVHNVKFSREYMYYLGRKHWINAYEDLEKGKDELLYAIKKECKQVSISSDVQEKIKKRIIIVSYGELIERGFDAHKISKNLVENDMGLYPHILQENEGEIEQWEEYLSNYPDTFKYMLDTKTNCIIGNWSIVVMSDEEFRKARVGQFLESELKICNTPFFMFGGVYNGYLLNLSINREYFKPENLMLLFESFLQQMESFAESGIFFRRWCVNVFSPMYEKLYQSLGFQYLAPNKASGNIYGLEFDPYPKHKVFQSREKLKKLYESKFQVSCVQMKDLSELYGQEKEVAVMIYETDQYIYPAMFEKREFALKIIKELFLQNDIMFQAKNLFVAKQEGKIIGIILWTKGPLRWNSEKILEISKRKNIPISRYLKQVEESYFAEYEKTEENIVSIINLCVDKRERGKGIGRKLLSAFLEEHKGETIRLCALEENVAAVQLYETMGFEIYDVSQGFSVDKRELPCLLMERKGAVAKVDK